LKNSPLSAFVLIGIAGLVGGVTYLASGDERIEADPEVVARPVLKTPKVMVVTPHEQKKARLMAEAQEELEEYKRTGKILPNGAIKPLDANGTPLYVHPELIEGVGRYGEPLFMMATYKKKAAVPLLRDMKRPKAENVATMRVLPKGQTPLTLGNKGKGSNGPKGVDAPGQDDEDDGGGKGGPKGGGHDAPDKPSGG
jgi:hypothetical protein